SPVNDITFDLHNDINLKLGIAGFSYSDLYKPDRLKQLAELFYKHVEAEDKDLWKEWQAYVEAGGKGYAAKTESNLIVKMAPHLGDFVAKLFHIEKETGLLSNRTERDNYIIQFKRNFVQRRALKRFTSDDLSKFDYQSLKTEVEALQNSCFPESSLEVDPEMEIAKIVVPFLEIEKEYGHYFSPKPIPVSAATRERTEWLRQQVSKEPLLLRLLDSSASEEERLENDYEFIKRVLGLLEAWVYVRYHSTESHDEVKDWVSYKQPEHLDYTHLVHINRPKQDMKELIVGFEDRLRRRDGFKLTDRRYNSKQIMNEVDYCLYCHERDKDSCSTGFLEKDGSYRRNPLGIELKGCPLDEKISEAHILKRDGESIAALATVMIDNPMVPGTGHRICNDCMKSCIFQKQEPVNIPQIETGVLSDILNLPYGFEIYGLLTRWNPLNVRRPFALPYNGKNVLVVGMGPAGYTLAHYLLNEGFGVIGIDGLKIEPMPEDLTGTDKHLPQPIKQFSTLYKELDERVLLGFGGVSEYGITVRWDKNFLTIIYLTLLRRSHFKVYGGTRFGGTITIEDAWQMGFDHIAIAAGAGRPTIIPMKNHLLRGIREASDFLMGLQLTGAYKHTAFANLQVQLPAIVIGGGLTAIDTATELMAYYPVQVEKTFERYEKMVAEAGVESFISHFDEEEQQILATFIEHGREVKQERERAKRAGEQPNFVQLVQKWGGVSIAYRKGLVDSPAYRLNHEEVAKALEEGISFIEHINPVEAIPDEYGAVNAIRFEKQTRTEQGKWINSGECVVIPARSVCVAAGTSPNIIYEKEYPGTFKLERNFFAGHKAIRNSEGKVELVAAHADKDAFFTSYNKDGKLISYYGDNHPAYNGNVVKAMASSKAGYLHVRNIFDHEVDNLNPDQQPAREQKFRELLTLLDEQLTATVVKVDRLTANIVEVIVKAPLAARKFQPGQFYRLQNFEVDSQEMDGTKMMLEGIALTGAWTDVEKGWLSLIVLEMGVSSRLCASLQLGQKVVVMGPTGTPTEIPEGESVLLAGGGLGNAVLFSIAKALKQRGNRVIYFAGYKKGEDLFKREEIEASTDQVIWSVDTGQDISPQRPQDHPPGHHRRAGRIQGQEQLP
ncbi:MAG: FAD-dependent oxidoreductase, partial [Blastocatellia bacterium]|nr:FAD-dependent oxidoreductase [Blastocatellia bacterium]